MHWIKTHDYTFLVDSNITSTYLIKKSNVQNIFFCGSRLSYTNFFGRFIRIYMES